VPVAPGFRALKRLAVEHPDGWGLAAFDEAVPELHNCAHPAFACRCFRDYTRKLKTRTLVAHIRKASVGAVRKVNSHPFYARNLAFAHNGNVRNYREVRGQIEARIAPRILSELRGHTDSERCFGMMLSLLPRRREPTPDEVARALAKVTRFLTELTHRPRQRKPTALNFVVTNGEWMVATRHGRTLFRASHPGTHYVASERLWKGDEWVEVPEDDVVIVDADLSLRIGPLADFA